MRQSYGSQDQGDYDRLRKIAILGSTGIVGSQTLDVVRLNRDEMTVTALSCKNNIDKLEKQIREFHPSVAAVFEEKAANDLKVRIADLDVKVLSGITGLTCMAPESGADIMFSGIVGMIGILPTIAAINEGIDIALANKETSVTAGHIIKPLAQEKHAAILPVDSEHSAIFQAMQGRGDSAIRRIILTASGGPFYNMSEAELAHVTVREALAHPTWSMGPKITIDSATMVNKGLEIIEANWFFDVPPEQIDVLIQRESLIHSAVEYADGSVIAQMGPSDMRIPIQYALTYPERAESPVSQLDLAKAATLTFERPDYETFGCINLCRTAFEKGGLYPAAVNAANEKANELFRCGKIRFLDIERAVEAAFDCVDNVSDYTLEQVFETDRAVRAETERLFL